MGTHPGPTSHWVEALWGHTLDQHHTGLELYGDTHWTNITLVWSSMGTYTGPTSHWVEALWGHTLDQHHTELKLYGDIHWTNITLG